MLKCLFTMEYELMGDCSCEAQLNILSSVTFVKRTWKHSMALCNLIVGNLQYLVIYSRLQLIQCTIYSRSREPAWKVSKPLTSRGVCV